MLVSARSTMLLCCSSRSIVLFIDGEHTIVLLKYLHHYICSTEDVALDILKTHLQYILQRSL